jgi:hypothetical protein
MEDSADEQGSDTSQRTSAASESPATSSSPDPHSGTPGTVAPASVRSKIFVEKYKKNCGNGSLSSNMLHGEGAYSAILQNRNNRFFVKNLHGDGEADCLPGVGTFYNKDDHRIKKATVKSFFPPKQNVSFSFDPTALTCNNCKNRPAHSIINLDSDHCSVFVLSDQCFPPTLPAVGPSGLTDTAMLSEPPCRRRHCCLYRKFCPGF